MSESKQSVGRTAFVPVQASLADLAGRGYCEAVCQARAALTGEAPAELLTLATTPVDFLPADFQARQLALLARTGAALCPPLTTTPAGAGSAAFAAATKTAAAPLNGCGSFRVGEDGRLYLITKAEHYHTPVGHAFPGYRLLDHARRLGLPAATHNNTRGALTRRLEEELVRTANGLAPGDGAGLDEALHSPRGTVLNRVLNLETGSLAVEAALKLVLARCYAPLAESPAGIYRGLTPVVIVMGNDAGGLQANYHGTTLLTQTLRGMWPELHARAEAGGLYRVVAVRPNDEAGLRAAFAQYDRGPHKVVALFHEIVMMNYGARVLTPDFLRLAYELCRAHDAATVVDEIQSGLWHPQLYMFREYGLQPAMVAVGKGFPGGEYCASRLLFNARFDSLPQFGALVTNGQEDLASLAYLVTMRWAEANAAVTRAIGDYYEARLRELAAGHAGLVAGVAGSRHLLAVAFHDVAPAKAFCAHLNRRGFDISVQTYKADCPPAALTKLPLIAGYELVDHVVAAMADALRALAAAPAAKA